jgi:hypothetical protein
VRGGYGCYEVGRGRVPECERGVGCQGVRKGDGMPGCEGME